MLGFRGLLRGVLLARPAGGASHFQVVAEELRAADGSSGGGGGEGRGGEETDTDFEELRGRRRATQGGWGLGKRGRAGLGGV